LTFLLDTNVLSETRRARPDAGVVDWLRHADDAALHISVLTIGEIAKGITLLAKRDPVAAASLHLWLNGIRLHYAARIISIDAEIAETWGQMNAERSLPVVDGLLAATARVHGMTLVTRNVRDVEGTGVMVVNPWTD